MAKRSNLKAAARLQTMTDNPAPVAARTEAAIERARGVEKLDLSRPYGTVTGEFFVSGVAIKYEQGQGKGRPSKIFDNERRRVYREGEKPSVVPVMPRSMFAPEPVNMVNPDPDDDNREEAMPPMNLDVGETAVEAEVNLTAWAEHMVKYRWAQIRDAIEARYGRVVNDEAEARDFLQEQGLGKGSGRSAEAEEE